MEIIFYHLRKKEGWEQMKWGKMAMRGVERERSGEERKEGGIAEGKRKKLLQLRVSVRYDKREGSEKKTKKSKERKKWENGWGAQEKMEMRKERKESVREDGEELRKENKFFFLACLRAREFYFKI